jgi:hypothetical protein
MGVPAYRRVGVPSLSCQMLLKTTDFTYCRALISPMSPIGPIRSHAPDYAERRHAERRHADTPAPLVTFLPILTIFGKTDALFYASVQYTGR